MTDDERLAEIERWNSGKGGYLPEPIHLIIERLLRVTRDQRAELAQARQAITNMRQRFDVLEAKVSPDARTQIKRMQDFMRFYGIYDAYSATEWRRDSQK
jgi:hypothetical protein